MLRPIVTAAALILALMVLAKDGRLFHLAALTASCSVVSRSNGWELDACRPGKLEGFPDLRRRNCSEAGVAGRREYWRCPVP